MGDERCAITGVAAERRRERLHGPPAGENSPRIGSNYCNVQAHPPRRAVAAIATSRAKCIRAVAI